MISATISLKKCISTGGVCGASGQMYRAYEFLDRIQGISVRSMYLEIL
jgi:hypothetical protein